MEQPGVNIPQNLLEPRWILAGVHSLLCMVAVSCCQQVERLCQGVEHITKALQDKHTTITPSKTSPVKPTAEAKSSMRNRAFRPIMNQQQDRRVIVTEGKSATMCKGSYLKMAHEHHTVTNEVTCTLAHSRCCSSMSSPCIGHTSLHLFEFVHLCCLAGSVASAAKL